jgi:hypothetical protein
VISSTEESHEKRKKKERKKEGQMLKFECWFVGWIYVF